MGKNMKDKNLNNKQNLRFMSSLENLPNEILSIILQKLDYSNLLRLSQVSERVKQFLFLNNSFWKERYFSEYSKEIPLKFTEESTWRERYLASAYVSKYLDRGKDIQKDILKLGENFGEYLIPLSVKFENSFLVEKIEQLEKQIRQIQIYINQERRKLKREELERMKQEKLSELEEIKEKRRKLIKFQGYLFVFSDNRISISLFFKELQKILFRSSFGAVSMKVSDSESLPENLDFI
jgi:hypothetical protein